MRIAERIAQRDRALALVTGEVVGQVASQTLENMKRITEVVPLPVLRPLIGMDKEEITVQAQRLGTYPISIIPDQDCCTLFTPKHPATGRAGHDVERAEASLPIRRDDREGDRRGGGRGVHVSRYKMTASQRRENVKFTPGKLAEMKAVSDARGVIAAAAMDQRGSLQKSLAKEKGGEIGARELEEFKVLVTEVLTRHASAILSIPNSVFPRASAGRRTPGC